MSLPVCLSIADVLLRQSDTVASLRHRSWWCNALWDVVTIHLSLPLTLMFPTLAIAPSAWQRPYRKCSQVDSEPSLCNIESPWQRPFISFASSACIIGWRQIWSTWYLGPLPCTSSFPPFLQQHALALCLMYTDINAIFFHAGCEWKEEVLVPMRPVWKRSDKRQNCCLKSGSGVLLRLLLQDNKRKAIHILSRSFQRRYITTGSHSPSQLFCCKVDTDKIRLLCLPGVPMSIKVSLECWTWSLEPTHRATLSSTQHLSPTASAEKKGGQSHCTAKWKQKWNTEPLIRRGKMAAFYIAWLMIKHSTTDQEKLVYWAEKGQS